VVRGVDLLAVSAALVAGVMTGVYILLMQRQGDQPLPWVLGVLCAGALLATYAAPVQAARRRAALMIAGVGLVALGLLAMLTIGFPIVIAGTLALPGSSRPTLPAPVDRRRA